jgi:hypothetical protein
MEVPRHLDRKYKNECNAVEAAHQRIHPLAQQTALHTHDAQLAAEGLAFAAERLDFLGSGSRSQRKSPRAVPPAEAVAICRPGRRA